MRRRLFNLLAAVSLVLCVATVVLWVRSVAYAQDVLYNSNVHESQSGWGEIAFRSNQGVLAVELSLYRYDAETLFPVVAGLPGWYRSSYPGGRNYRTPNELWLGIPVGWEVTELYPQGFYTDPPPRHGTEFAVWAPHWLVAIVVLLPALVVMRYRRREAIMARKRRRGHCPTCGYDLRATPARCPECGTTALASTTMSS